ncbi:MAG: ATP-binding cassette domain-containing protein [Lachnospiraceae bacterium]|nr:ATP-binding cassette domain-containing protein [Lachnospiraceae bacterium]
MTIYLDNICKTYSGIAVLKDFSIAIEDDRCYAFIGPEGCGKTTVLKIFKGDIKPDSGKVSRMGDYKYPTLQTAYVAQECDLRPRKNAIWHVKKADRTVNKAFAIAELSRFFTEEKMQQPVSELTESEMRLVQIVRAMVLHADFIVLDEPFKGMSPQEKETATAYILEKRGRRPLLIASREDNGLDFARKTYM